MAFGPNFYNSASDVNAQVAFNEGLRSYMLRVYNWMASGLVLTGIIAYLVANTSLRDIFYRVVTSNGFVVGLAPTGLGLIAMLAPLAFVLVMSFGVNRLSYQTAKLLFWIFCGVMGISMANIFLIYTGTSITRTFFITAGMFAGMSLFGYTTRSNLTGLGSFLAMGLFGLVIAMVVNIFMHSSQLAFITSIGGVLIFTGLAATDTQRIKLSYEQFYQYGGAEFAAKRSVYDALGLYLNFINLFNFLIQFLGVRQGSNN